ncbi:MAG: hypothetical protein ACRBCS_05810 [Cellvibrionaceae bacterium]
MRHTLFSKRYSTMVFLFTIMSSSIFSAQIATAEKTQRTADGKPDFNGIWQTMGSAHWNIEPHMAQAGPSVKMGAIGAISGGLGIVEGGKIPYKKEALEQRNKNKAEWLTLDPVVKCYLPGVPRATYLPHPFQIVQSKNNLLITYEFAGADRIVHMNQPDYEAPVESWMGHNLGSWDGDTLVINVTAQMPESWLDSAGNFHTDMTKVEERYTPMGPNAIWYEATITDPTIYTRPWKISLPLYRRLDKNMQLLDFKCVEFVEELLYGNLRKK